MTDAQLIAIAAKLKDPTVVHAAMLRGEIAKPALRDMLHAYGGDVLAKWDAAQPVPDAALHTAVRLVLDATPEHLPMALDALRDHAGAAPVAQQAEPSVHPAFKAAFPHGFEDEHYRDCALRGFRAGLAAHPQQPARVPLTEAQVIELRSRHGWAKETIRAIEAAILRGIVPAPTTGGGDERCEPQNTRC
jgi:hypothetical protein